MHGSPLPLIAFAVPRKPPCRMWTDLYMRLQKCKTLPGLIASPCEWTPRLRLRIDIHPPLCSPLSKGRCTVKTMATLKAAEDREGKKRRWKRWTLCDPSWTGPSLCFDFGIGRRMCKVHKQYDIAERRTGSHDSIRNGMLLTTTHIRSRFFPDQGGRLDSLVGSVPACGKSRAHLIVCLSCLRGALAVHRSQRH